MKICRVWLQLAAWFEDWDCVMAFVAIVKKSDSV